MKSTYYAWQGMRQRCNNPQNKDYLSYGGRGITVDPSWEIFTNFRRDMGVRPKGLILDRIDVNGNYCKANCRWADAVTSGFNRRPFVGEVALRSNNTTGISGVSLQGNRWRVKVKGEVVYRSYDFFEACCIRKSFEAHSQRNTLWHTQ